MIENNTYINWFERWFDSPYYDLLYSHRDKKEAECFIDNLFTSFGYFADKVENYLALQHITQNLKSKGILVLDYINSTKAMTQLVKEEKTVVGDICFHISRKIENNNIIKQIQCLDNGKLFTFEEKIQALSYADFKDYFSFCKLTELNTFGDYNLNPYDEQQPERLIPIAKKK